MVGSNSSETMFRVLKIDRTVVDELAVTEDDVIYTRQEITDLLEMIDDGNRASGGLHKYVTAYGIVGFARFLEGYYMVLITKRSPVAMIGGHCIYHIDDTVLIPVPHTAGKIEKNSAEARYVDIFSDVDLSKNFYFSYTYDLTHSLQHNMTSLNNGEEEEEEVENTNIKSENSGNSSSNVSGGNGRDGSNASGSHFPSAPYNSSTSAPPKSSGSSSADSTDFSDRDFYSYNSMFAWNHFLLKPSFRCLKSGSEWILPVIHGFVDQSKMQIFGRTLFVTLIGRRSRYFAGARYLKRGVNDQGYVANEVETEQIVHDARTTSSKTLARRPLAEYTSFVQVRGSIPLNWSQETSNMSPTPPIQLNAADPFHSAAALHFDSMFRRYGTPVIILNLIKQATNKTKRESVLLDEFTDMIRYLNQFLPDPFKLQYIAWDMAQAAKSSEHDVISILEEIVSEVLSRIGFFHSGPDWSVHRAKSYSIQGGVPYGPNLDGRRQDGVLRTNCIDCLDRTNAAQFIAGKCALAHQLYALGVLDRPHLQFDSDAANLLTEMYHDLGDTIALQYGGSQLVNTVETYRKTNAWSSHSRDMINSIRRYYNNSFTDAEKQDAINLFLGNFIPEQDKLMLWELNSDHYLHNEHPSFKRSRSNNYLMWWTRDQRDTRRVTREKKASFLRVKSVKSLFAEDKQDKDHFFVEYYQPSLFSQLNAMFMFTMNTSLRMQIRENYRSYDYSPFSVRTTPSRPISVLAPPGKKNQQQQQQLSLTIQDKNSTKSNPSNATKRLEIQMIDNSPKRNNKDYSEANQESSSKENGEGQFGKQSALLSNIPFGQTILFGASGSSFSVSPTEPNSETQKAILSSAMLSDKQKHRLQNVIGDKPLSPTSSTSSGVFCGFISFSDIESPDSAMQIPLLLDSSCEQITVRKNENNSKNKKPASNSSRHSVATAATNPDGDGDNHPNKGSNPNNTNRTGGIRKPTAGGNVVTSTRNRIINLDDEERESALREIIVQSLLPAVESNDVVEYESYANFFNNEDNPLLAYDDDLPSIHSIRTDKEEFISKLDPRQQQERIAYDKYIASQKEMAESAGFATSFSLIDPRDTGIYEKFIDLPRVTAAAQFVSSGGKVFAAAEKYELYSSWLHSHSAHSQLSGFNATSSSLSPAPSQQQTSSVIPITQPSLSSTSRTKKK